MLCLPIFLALLFIPLRLAAAQPWDAAISLQHAGDDVTNTSIPSLLSQLEEKTLREVLLQRTLEWDRFFSSWIMEASPRVLGGEPYTLPPMFPFSTPLPLCDGSPPVPPSPHLCSPVDRQKVNNFCNTLVASLPASVAFQAEFSGPFAIALIEVAGRLSALGCKPEALHLAGEAMTRLSLVLEGIHAPRHQVLIVVKPITALQWDGLPPLMVSRLEALLASGKDAAKLSLPSDAIWALGSMVLLETMDGLTPEFFNSFLANATWLEVACSEYPPPPWAVLSAPRTTVLFLAFRACTTLAELNLRPKLWAHRCLDLPLIYVLPIRSMDLLPYYASIYLLPAAQQHQSMFAQELRQALNVSEIFMLLTSHRKHTLLDELWRPPFILPAVGPPLHGLFKSPTLEAMGRAFSLLFVFKGFPGLMKAELEPDLHLLWNHDIDDLMGIVPTVEANTPVPGMEDSGTQRVFSEVIYQYLCRFIPNLNLPMSEVLHYARVFARYIQVRVLRFGRAQPTPDAIAFIHHAWSQEWKKQNIISSLPSADQPSHAHTPPTLPLFLFSEFFLSTNPERNWEIQATLLMNAELPEIHRLVIRTSSADERQSLQELMQRNMTKAVAEKIIIIHDDSRRSGRLTLQQVLQWCDQHTESAILVAIANSDILFTERSAELLTTSAITARLANGLSAISLSRWPVDQPRWNHEPLIAGYMGQDAWVFKFPISPPLPWKDQYQRCVGSLGSWPALRGRESEFCSPHAPSHCLVTRSGLPCTPANLTFEIGRLFSDMRMNWVYWVMGLEVINPSPHVITKHIHRDLTRSEEYQQTSLGPPGFKAFTTLIDDLPLDPYVFHVYNNYRP